MRLRGQLFDDGPPKARRRTQSSAASLMTWSMRPGTQQIGKFDRLLLGWWPNQAKSSLPIGVQKPFLLA